MITNFSSRMPSYTQQHFASESASADHCVRVYTNYMFTYINLYTYLTKMYLKHGRGSRTQTGGRVPPYSSLRTAPVHAHRLSYGVRRDWSQPRQTGSLIHSARLSSCRRRAADPACENLNSKGTLFANLRPIIYYVVS